MKLHIRPAAYALGIHEPAAARFDGVRVIPEADTLASEAATLLQELAREEDAFFQRPEVRGYRTLFAKLGYAEQTPAGERLVHGFLKRGFRSFNNVIDAYNLVAARNVAGLGLHDADRVAGDIVVDRADGTQRIQPLFKSKTRRIREGDLFYAATEVESAMAWLGKRDVDSDRFKVRDDSTSLVLVVLGNASTTRAHNRRVCVEVFDLLRETVPNCSMRFLSVETGMSAAGPD